MPLYSCELCGWTTTAFRFDAVTAHTAECPECAGQIRLTFDPRVEPQRAPSLTPVRPRRPDPQPSVRLVRPLEPRAPAQRDSRS
jgi:hypothetical protein